MAHGSGHQRIMATSGHPRSCMTCPNARHCLFLPEPKRRIHSRKNARTDRNAIPAPTSDASPAIRKPGHAPYAKPISVSAPLNPKRGGCDERTECQLRALPTAKLRLKRLAPLGSLRNAGEVLTDGRREDQHTERPHATKADAEVVEERTDARRRDGNDGPEDEPVDAEDCPTPVSRACSSFFSVTRMLSDYMQVSHNVNYLARRDSPCSGGRACGTVASRAQRAPRPGCEASAGPWCLRWMRKRATGRASMTPLPCTLASRARLPLPGARCPALVRW